MNFSSRRVTSVPYYWEIIECEGKPYASIVALTAEGSTRYHGTTTNGFKATAPTIVDLKKLIFEHLDEHNTPGTQSC